MGITTLAAFKDYLEWRGSTSDAFLESVLDAATSFIERETGRLFSDSGDDPVEKTFSTGGRVFLAIPDLREATTVTLAGAELEAQGFDDTEGYLLIGAAPHTSIRLAGQTFGQVTEADLVIEGKWGHDPAPPEIVDAVLALATRMVRARAASYADTIADPEAGILSYFRQLPPQVAAVVESWTKPRQHVSL